MAGISKPALHPAIVEPANKTAYNYSNEQKLRVCKRPFNALALTYLLWVEGLLRSFAREKISHAL